MRRAWLAVVTAIGLLPLAAACGGSGDDPADLASSEAPAGAAAAVMLSSDEGTPVTGIGQLDVAIGEILREDVDALMRRVHITARPCVEDAGDGSPPGCPPGSATGSLVDAMFVAGCEGEYRTSEAEVRSMLELRAFRYAGVPRVHAVVSGALDGTNNHGFVVAVDVRDEIAAAASGQLWAFDEDGRLVAMALGCGAMPAADMLRGFFPSPEYVISPAS